MKYNPSVLLTITLSSSVLLVSCASNKQPNIIIDTNGVDMSAYNDDLSYCQQFKEQVESEAGKSAAKGAALGAATGAIWGGGSSGARRGAGAGIITGVAAGASQTKKQKEQVVKNCLRTKGYKILN